MSPWGYHRARTLAERKRRLAIAATLSPVVVVLLLLTLAVLSNLEAARKNPWLVTAALIGVPVVFGVIGELWVGRDRAQHDRAVEDK